MNCLEDFQSQKKSEYAQEILPTMIVLHLAVDNFENWTKNKLHYLDLFLQNLKNQQNLGKNRISLDPN